MRSAAPPLGGVVVAVLEADEDDDEEVDEMRPRVPRSREAREPTHMKADLWLLLLPPRIALSEMRSLLNPDNSTPAAACCCC